MAKKDPRIDAYIAKSADFAQPILKHIRAVVHRGCPTVTENIKWGMPFFEDGRILCFMAAFKAHAAFGFWRGRLNKSDLPTIAAKDTQAMGHFGRLTSTKDLPSERAMIALIKQATKASAPARKSTAVTKKVAVPKYFMDALKKNKKALAAFSKFSPSHQREYVQWVNSAKREETRLRRLAQAVVWLAEGKPQNWKSKRK
jgi:uncharacterized protein YdeI (YjbR/CyaY-like superfamily)